MNRPSPRLWDVKTVFAVVWMAFTLALAVWLFIFHGRMFDQLQALNIPETQDIVRHGHMVATELLSMIIALAIGGASLLYVIWLEKRRSLQIREFFAVFSHELKTSLSRLRLQSESLQEDFRKNARGGPALRLLDDIAKLEVQLENSLWVAGDHEDRLLKEMIPVSKILGELAPQFPLLVHLSSEVYLRADRRAVESIFKNIFQNAVVHGEAQNLWIQVKDLGSSRVLVSFRDDGKGFDGDRRGLGEIFRRHSRSSGSGLGLFLIRKLALLVDGQARFLPSRQGFEVEVEIPGSLQKPAGA